MEDMDESLENYGTGGIICKDIQDFFQISSTVFPPIFLGDVIHGSFHPMVTGLWVDFITGLLVVLMEFNLSGLHMEARCNHPLWITCRIQYCGLYNSKLLDNTT